MGDGDNSRALQDQVQAARKQQAPLVIRGGGSKDFYGRAVNGDILDTRDHQGVLNYEPTELVITARAGTPLKAIEKILAEHNQMLAFEPPSFAGNATLGGTIACNLSGPRRACSGAARDFVLGSTLLNGKGEILHFGGEVMKNVAGYDVSRLLAGAMGTLGVLLEVSLKVLPRPESSLTLRQSLAESEALDRLHEWSQLPLPISASCFQGGHLTIRLCGTEGGVQAAGQAIGGDLLADADAFWQSVKDQQHAFFQGATNLWRLSLASNARPLSLPGDSLLEWGGALRWLRSDAAAEEIFSTAAALQGHATLFRSSQPEHRVFQPLPDVVMRLQQKLKKAFDPEGIFNPGRMYAEL